MRSLLVTAGLLLAANFAANGEVAVVIPEESSKAVRAGADEFARLYCEVTGVRPRVSAEADGPGPFVRIRTDGSLWEGKCDAYRIRSLGDGLEIVGRNGRSAIYGVYDFFRRRAGARYFWDGDRLERKPLIDFKGMDVEEISRFEYRGCQYFAHRGLKRFQAEHWGFADWKREIDWALKNRLNLVMLRIGIEDLFQLAFPDVVGYPDPDVTARADAKEGYNLRTPFWSLSYRHLLRKAVIDYATDRGLMHPAEFGTLTHWFSRTPEDFLKKRNPKPLQQANENYAEPSGMVWDIREKEWFDAYWDLTEASIRHYGYSGLLFNPGFDERVVYSNREDNVRFKIDTVLKFNREAARRYPDAKLLMEGWDFYFTWKPEEVARFAREADPERTLIFDFTADGGTVRSSAQIPPGNNFSQWGITNRFPYVFGYMLELNPGSDIRGNYAKIRDRERAMRDDPMCKGYVIWPEASHTDIFAWRYFTDNCWRLSDRPVDDLLAGFCRDRYAGRAGEFLEVWRKVVSFSSRCGWGRSFPDAFDEKYSEGRNDPKLWNDSSRLTGKMPAKEIFDALSEMEWKGEFERRDMVDLARTTLDRLLFDGFWLMMRSWHALAAGKGDLAELKSRAERQVALVKAMAGLLELHGDFSIAETLAAMDQVEKIRNPGAEHLIFENAACGYCRSHHAEFARGWYVPLVDEIASTLVARAQARDFSPLPEPVDYREKLRRSEHPILDFAPDKSRRTEDNFRRLMREISHWAETEVK
jgi:hypothetical protein